MSTSAHICRVRGWKPGMVLQGTKAEAAFTIRITAIGEDTVLARRLTRDGIPSLGEDRVWNIGARGWNWSPLP